MGFLPSSCLPQPLGGRPTKMILIGGIRLVKVARIWRSTQLFSRMEEQTPASLPGR